MSKRIDNAIIFSTKPYEKTIFNEEWLKKCSKKELKDLYNTIYGWTTLVFYNEQYKTKCRAAMKLINKLLKDK